MSWKQDIIMKIEALNESVEKNKNSLNEHVDKLENGEKSRRKERNLLLQRAFKRVYDSLNNVDKKMMAKIKTDAYDTTRQLDKVERGWKNLLTNLKNADGSQEGAMKGLLQKLQADNLNIDVDSVTFMCNVSVGCNVLELETALVSAVLYHQGIYLKNDTFDHKMLVVKLADSQMKLRLGLSSQEYAYFVVSSQVGFPEGALKYMTVDAHAIAGQTFREGLIPVLLDSSIAQMKKNNQVVADGINVIVLKIKRPSRHPEATMLLTVSLFNTVLKGCPLFDTVQSGLTSADLADMTAAAKEQLNGTIHCDLELDDEDLNSLDMTNRRSVMSAAGIQSNGSCLQPPSAMTPAGVPRQYVTNGIPFTGVSTMPATERKSNGSRPPPPSAMTTSKVPSQGVSNNILSSGESAMPSMAVQSNGFRPTPPSEISTTTITSKGLTNGAQSYIESAMPATAIQSFHCPSAFPAKASSLAKYPRITVTKDNNSPSIPSSKAGIKRVPNLSDVREMTGEADVTIPFSPKPDKGMVSTMRPTAMAGKLTGALNKVQRVAEAVEAIEENNEVDRILEASRNAPNVEDMQKSLSSAECSREDDDSMRLEGPEVQEIPLHNRSVSFARKTNIVQDSTTPRVGRMQQRFRIEEGNTKLTDGQAGVAKRLVKQREDEDANATEFNENASEFDIDDPHLYLNASKAPSPTLADHTLSYDPAWDVGSGAVHEWLPSPLKPEQSFATKVGMSDKSKMEMSIWDIPDEESHSHKDIKGFNLALGLVDQIAINVPGDIGGGKFCMQSPVHIEYVPTFSKFLISEPEYNRIGVYSKGTLQFQGWFGGSNEPYKYPTSILYLDNGYLVVLERNKINIYDKDAKLFQELSGRYNGLAKDTHGNFFSTNLNRGDKTTFIIVFGYKNGQGIYVVKDSFPIDVANKDESKVRFLAVHAGKIYASDYGLHLIYVVDMETRNLRILELKFTPPCAKPCGILLDDRGYVLVADSGNHRLLVLNGEGELFREIRVKEEKAWTPSDIVKVRGKGGEGAEENHILVTYAGTDGTDGKVVRFKCT